MESDAVADTRSYWPCALVAHEAHYSIILGNEMDLLAHHFRGRDAGGYAVEGLVKKLARAKHPKLLQRVKFDSEASMFCAYGTDLDALHALATMLAGATGTSEAKAPVVFATPARRGLTDAEDDEARASLLAGFALSLNESSQRRFYELVPITPIGVEQRGVLDELHAENADVRCSAAERIRRFASNNVWSWGSFVGDPRVLDELLAALERERDERVLVALLQATAHVCARHLADLRMRARLEALLKHPSATVRQNTVAAVQTLFSWSWRALMPLFDDRDAKVRASVVFAASRWEESFQTRITDDYVCYPRPEELPADAYARVLRALADSNSAVRASAAAAIALIDFDGAGDVLREAAACEKVAKVRAAMQQASARHAYNAPFRPCRMVGALELTRFRRLKADGLDGPDVERMLRERHPALLEQADCYSRRGYFAATAKDASACTESLIAVAAAIRELA